MSEHGNKPRQKIVYSEKYAQYSEVCIAADRLAKQEAKQCRHQRSDREELEQDRPDFRTLAKEARSDQANADTTGYTSIVYRIPETGKVCKSFLPKYANTHFPRERKVYERFQAREHPSAILNYYGMDQDEPAGIILELAEHGSMHNFLWDMYAVYRRPPGPSTLYRWARQAAEALAFAHSCGVMHADVHCVNFLLDKDLNLKVADFAAATIDGGRPLSLYRTTHQLPPAIGHLKQITIESEIFALGSALYNMATGHDLFFPELDYESDKTEIVRRLRDGEFPDVNDLVALGSVIRRCWKLDFGTMQDVLEGIDVEAREAVVTQESPSRGSA